MLELIKPASGWLDRFPDTPGFFERHLRDSSRQFALLLVLGLALRISTFGDPNLHVDEAFYYVVGIEMHLDALPYVDIWDRKPIGLFLIYYLIAAVSTEIVAYQIVAWLFASSTAWIIARIARHWAGAQGSLLAGASYLFMLGPQEGYGGQAPVFYNLFVAASALLLLRSRGQLEQGRVAPQVYVAMSLCGIALTIKQTTLFESVFFGLFVVWMLWRSPVPFAQQARAIAGCAILGALPTLVSGLAYYGLGHWAEFWQAMVTSNLAKTKPSLLDMAANLLRMLLRLYPYVALVWLGVKLDESSRLVGIDRRFLICWLAAAVLGVIVVPNFYAHYALPLLVPLAVVASLALDRRDIGVFLATGVAAFTVVIYNPTDRTARQRSIESMHNMAAAIRDHDRGGGLLIYDGPPSLYAVSNKRPLTPMAFPHHLNHWIERNVSTIDTFEETKRILRNKPGVVVMSVFPSNSPANGDTRILVESYAFNNCKIVGVESSHEINHEGLVAIYGDCQEGAPDLIDY